MASEMVTIRMSRKVALERGLLLCKSCRYPENSHFRFEPKLCAYSSRCTGYEDDVRGDMVLVATSADGEVKS